MITRLVRNSSTFFCYLFLNLLRQDFHHCGLEPNDNVVNWGNRVEVLTCQLDNLAEYASSSSFFLWVGFTSSLASLLSLNTGSEKVRSRLAEHANDLLSLGADGFRLDAAKSKGLNEIESWPWRPDVETLLGIAASDIANITSRLTSSKILYYTSETVFGGAVTPNEYTVIGESSVHPW